MYVAVLLALLSPCLSVPPVKNKSSTNSYKIQAKSTQALYTIVDLLEEIDDKVFIDERCVLDKANKMVICSDMTNSALIAVLEDDDDVAELDADKEVPVLTSRRKCSTRRRRDVPWNLDRLNSIKLELDDSFMDNADVDVYILGSGIAEDHAEFGNRAHLISLTGGSVEDCDGSGTMYASLVGGASMGIARKAQIYAVQVMERKGDETEIDYGVFTKGVNYIENMIQSSAKRAVVLVGFELHLVGLSDKERKSQQRKWNNQLIRLSEVATPGGILVVVGAGDTESDPKLKDTELDACDSAPASAKGESAISGVLTVGAIDEDDRIISNLGECVDVFAPGFEVIAADSSGPTLETTCTGSLCAAALAAGVAAAHLRDNNKIDLETQKAMLINGATVTDLLMPEFNNEYIRTLRMAQTPRRVLHYTCGYYRSPELPTCTISTDCNKNVFKTFDDVGYGHLYTQANKSCGFEVFNYKNMLVIESSHYANTLGSYLINGVGDIKQIELFPGPRVEVDGVDISHEIINTDGERLIYLDEGVVTIHHNVYYEDYRNPEIVLQLIEHQIQLTYDCTSGLEIKLLNITKYSGNTGGLCGFYDGIGRNDYKLKDGTQLEAYDVKYHKSWQKECSVEVEDVDEPGCEKEARRVCDEKFADADNDKCFVNENMFKEKEACVAEMQSCCGCNKAAKGWEDKCCKDSYFGKLEQRKEGCNFCGKSCCDDEKIDKDCIVDISQSCYDYMDTRSYAPKDCCYYIVKDDVQECLAPRSDAMMWDKPMPVCTVKKCKAPVLPNNYTTVTPLKDQYECGDVVTVECTDCYKVPSTILTCISTCADNYTSEAVWDKEVPGCVEKDCLNPGLPVVDNDKGLNYPLSWIEGHNDTTCEEEITFKCDVCYDLVGEENITCTQDEIWKPKNPSCKLKSCRHPETDLTEHLIVDVPNNKCNDTVNYDCDDKCWKLHGPESRTCTPGTKAVWDVEQPECKIKHCPPLNESDITDGWYTYTNEKGEEINITLASSDVTYTKVEECGAQVKAHCDTCWYMCGAEYRDCVVDSAEDEPEWGGEKPMCLRKQCVAITNDRDETHAVQVKPAPEGQLKYDCAESVEYDCEECYEYKSGDRIRNCTEKYTDMTYNSEAEFNGEQFMCKIKNCDALEDPANGKITKDNTQCDKTAEFECDKCYKIIGDTELTCEDNKGGPATWSGVPPTCELWKCPAREEPANAKFVQYSEDCDKEIQYECDECYCMHGERESRCLEGGTNDQGDWNPFGVWDKDPPTCKKYTCPAHEEPTNGKITVNKHECSQSTKFECDKCYTLMGSNTTTCQAGDKWSCTNGANATWSHPAPTCLMKTCKAPEVPPNTKIVEKKTQYNCGETIVVECEDCYELGVKTTLRCNGDDKWNDTVPECTIKSCQMPPLPYIDHKYHTVDNVTGKDIIYADFTVKPPELECNNTVRYFCDRCYTLKGNDTIKCHDDKTWDAEPSCILKRCDTPVLTEHLKIKYNSSKVEDRHYCRDTVQYQCDDQCWALHGEGNQRCDAENGTQTAKWSHEQPVCKIKTCPAVDDIEHGTIDSQVETPCGRKVTYKCKPCYRLVGEAVRECNSSSQWSTPPPTCESVCCPSLPIYTEQNYNEDGSSLQWMKYNYTYSGELIEGCGIEHVCQEAAVSCDDCWEYMEGGEELPSPPPRVCTHPDSGEGPGYWTNVDKVCTRKTCPRREPVLDTHHSRYTNYTYMVDKVKCHDKVTFECEGCYENTMGTQMEQSCLSKREWSDVIPNCTLKECGELPVVDHCWFPDNKTRTCGWGLDLTCDSCYCTEKCEDPTDTLITNIRCEDDHQWAWREKEPEIKIKTCPAPPVIPKAEMTDNIGEGEQYTCGNTIRYHCDECYKLKEKTECDCAELRCDGSGGDSCCTGSWKGDLPQCIPIECPALSEPVHAHTVTNENGCKMKAIFECDEGYEWVDGDLERMCTTSETWTGKAPVCRIKNCTALEAPANGQISHHGHSYKDTVVFTCDECYEFPEEFTDDSFQELNQTYHRYNILTCEATGNWNGSVPACRKKACGHPGVINNGALTERKFSCNDTIGYTCNTGYKKASGSDSRTCGSDKRWSGTETVCEVLDCGQPDRKNHSRVDVDKTTYNHKAHYECDRCYNTDDDIAMEVKCNASGLWSDPAPVCQQIKCTTQTKPKNGDVYYRRTDRGDTDCGQIAEFDCDVGYRLTGGYSTVCTTSGTWAKHEPPVCKRECCQKEELEHGEVDKLDGGFCYKDRIEYKCDDCYEMKGGNRKRTCESDNTGPGWSGSKPSCKLKECDTQFVVPNGQHWGSNKCSGIRQFQCNRGYDLFGSRQLECLANGNWSGDIPECKPITCDCSDASIKIKNGNEQIDDMQGNCAASSTYVYYECEDGYEMKGTDYMWCKSDGTWSGEPPKCIQDKCQEPVRPANGNVTWDTLKEGGRATYNCHTCHKMDGEVVADCHDGQWSTTPPVCTEVTCARPGVPMYAHTTVNTTIAYSCGETVTYECKENHVLHGDSVRECGENGRWNTTVPTCLDLTCPKLEKPENGNMRKYDDNKLEFTCNTGYQLHGDHAIRECMDGQWSGVDVICRIENCGDPGIPAYGNRTGSGTFEYKSVVGFTCHHGYYISGSSDRKCQHDGTWSGTQPECVCNSCQELGEMANGYLLTTDAHQWKSSVTYYCNDGYELVGENATRTCEASGLWSGVAPTCQRVKCGSPPQPDGGFIVKTVEGAQRYKDEVKIKCKDEVYTGTCSMDGQWSFNDFDDIANTKKCSCDKVWKWVTETRITITPGHCFMGKCFPDTKSEKQVKVYKEVPNC